MTTRRSAASTVAAVAVSALFGLGGPACSASGSAPRGVHEAAGAPALLAPEPARGAPATGPTLTFAEAAARLRDRAVTASMVGEARPPAPTEAAPATPGATTAGLDASGARARVLFEVLAALPPGDPRLAGVVDETHRVLLTELATELESGLWASQLVELAAAWQRRGARIEALSVLALLLEHDQMDALSRSSLRLAATTFVQAGARSLGLAAIGERDDAAVAVAAALHGDVAWAESTAAERAAQGDAGEGDEGDADGGDAAASCAIFAAVARRHALEGRHDAAARARARAAAQGDVHRKVSPDDGWTHGACLAQIARAHVAAGDRDGAAGVLAGLAPGDVDSACGVLRELGGEPVHDLLDVPVLIVSAYDRDAVLAREGGCPVALADVASRRGDRALVLRLLRHWGDADVVADGMDDDGAAYAWAFRLRVGLQDPLAVAPSIPDEPLEATRTELALARLLDETPRATVERVAFETRFPALAPPP